MTIVNAKLKFLIFLPCVSLSPSLTLSHHPSAPLPLPSANPACEAVGCGEWSPPMIQNPNYKGKWKAPMIDNPDYDVSPVSWLEH